MSANDNDPAYPTTISEGHGCRGMTMRQAYKIAALQGILSRNLRPNSLGNSHINHAQVGGVFYHDAVLEAAKVADDAVAEDAAHASRKGGEK